MSNSKLYTRMRDGRVVLDYPHLVTDRTGWISSWRCEARFCGSLIDDGCPCGRNRPPLDEEVAAIDREELIAEGFASLVDVVGILRSIGGHLWPEQQHALRRAEDVIARARVTP